MPRAITPLLTFGAFLLLSLFGADHLHGYSWPLEPVKIQNIDREVTFELRKQKIVGAAVGVIQNGKMVYCNGYGYADLDKRIPFSTNTICNWASNSKPLLAVAAMQLVEENRMKLDASVTNYLRNLPIAYRPITIRHLLAHQSGYPHYTNGTIRKNEIFPKSPRPTDPLHSLHRFAASSLIAAPGERYSYSSYAYVLLSAAVQEAGKMPLLVQLNERITKPAGMTSFQLDHSFQNQSDWAQGYDRDRSGDIRLITDYANDWKHGAGGYKSNIVDFAKWAALLVNRELLKPESYREMWTPQKTESGTPTEMGLGFFVTTQNGTLKVSHNGGQPETATRLVLYPDRGSAVVAISNCGFADIGAVSTAVYRGLNR